MNKKELGSKTSVYDGAVAMDESNEYERMYADRFSRYTENTDGKVAISTVIAEIAQARGCSSLLDLGSGDGGLANLLVPTFQSVTVVEKNPAFVERLESFGFDKVIVDRMEHVELANIEYDCVLFSYSLNGSKPSDFANLLKRVRQFAFMTPLILLATDSSHSPWNTVADSISELLGIRRSGGVVGDLDRVRAAGEKPKFVASVDTKIYGTDIRDLSETLAVFFLRHFDFYMQRIDEIQDILDQNVVPSVTGGVELSVCEEVYELR